MKKIGFVDYFISEWHANNYPAWIERISAEMGVDYKVSYAWAELETSPLDGISTAAGSYPLDFVGDPELAWSGIGQSTDMVNPYAILRLVCAIANGGTEVEPSMVADTQHSSTLLVSPATADALTEMMRFTANEHYNASELFPGMNICAKTGTAELGDGTSHSWFVGYLEKEEHPYAFVTLVERGGFGITAAGSVTGEVLQWAVENLEG